MAYAWALVALVEDGWASSPLKDVSCTIAGCHEAVQTRITAEVPVTSFNCTWLHPAVIATLAQCSHASGTHSLLAASSCNTTAAAVKEATLRWTAPC